MLGVVWRHPLRVRGGVTLTVSTTPTPASDPRDPTGCTAVARAVGSTGLSSGVIHRAGRLSNNNIRFEPRDTTTTSATCERASAAASGTSASLGRRVVSRRVLVLARCVITTRAMPAADHWQHAGVRAQAVKEERLFFAKFTPVSVNFSVLRKRW